MCEDFTKISFNLGIYAKRISIEMSFTFVFFAFVWIYCLREEKYRVPYIIYEATFFWSRSGWAILFLARVGSGPACVSWLWSCAGCRFFGSEGKFWGSGWVRLHKILPESGHSKLEAHGPNFGSGLGSTQPYNIYLLGIYNIHRHSIHTPLTISFIVFTWNSNCNLNPAMSKSLFNICAASLILK